MKKISLKSLNLREVEQLTRSQLKEVLGGGFMSTSDSTSGTTTAEDCSVSCGKPGDSCTTSDCKTGSCGYTDGYLQCAIS